ncbi:HlyD family efflux transporter periplasmic adaptor subunit [Mangrovimicrobium sediminis]|uniref:HlyD family efflux transporter periplasmic adaptor subunit n=1 Tax=Mangrovimicrobium sediminis TaxID=2562682 RepID=A0A4Z0M7P2_9GAMM|nr:efflux RND transporter periplasmic adaptor subunit [Haliea sp. SAOS-164]TGD75325.1 HlyD family efflux transporter periplasmic adaptor subunit [Haliea sp. SAOS-164]
MIGARRRTLTLGSAAIALVLVAVGLRQCSGNSAAPMQVLFEPVASVRQAPFEARVLAGAELDAAQSVLLSSDLPSNRAKAVFLVPEGELVQAGDVVARFDPTTFREELENIDHEIREQQIKLQQAQADLALHENGAGDRAAQLEHDIEVARLRLESLDQASIPIRIAQAEKEARRAQAESERAAQLLATERELFERGLTPQKTLDEAELQQRDALAAQRLAQHQLQVLNEVTLPSERRQAEMQWRNSQREVEVYQQAYRENRRKLEAAAAQIENRIELLQLERERTAGYLEQTELRAPVSGLLLYKTVSMQGEKRKVQVGDSLWNRQGFAVIPDLSSLVARVTVGESEVGKLRPGQVAAVYPAAWPDLELRGAVDTVGMLAAQSAEAQERQFSVRIRLEEVDPRLRPGMSARASILVQSLDSATLIPVESVFYQQNQGVVFLWRDGDPLRVPVRLGLSDGEQVVVEEGLAAGQEVMLVYPDNFDVAD